MPSTFPSTRPRRLRQTPWIRDLVREHHLHIEDLIWPVFVTEGKDIRQPIDALPGIYRYSIDMLLTQLEEVVALGIPAIALFPVIAAEVKSDDAKEAYGQDNLICRAIKEVKHRFPELGIIGDVALDPYTSHGQDGVMVKGEVDNDKTVELLCKQALTLAQAGCDIVAPSDMMDGRVRAIRKVLDQENHIHTIILSYAAKYASSFYGPFRDAVGSAGALKGDKATYQMDIANAEEAFKEVQLDIDEGADIVMVKPGMMYLDIIARLKEKHNIPIAAYQVSGEYAMMKAAAQNGWLDETRARYESLIAFKRAGASMILTYTALEMAKDLQT